MINAVVLVATVADPLPAVASTSTPPRADVLAFTGFPKQLWRALSSNPNERTSGALPICNSEG